MRFYGYKHWTLEDPPRCFNVGKGVKRRAQSCCSRNHKWHAIVKRYGLRIEVCIGPVTNEEACLWEIAWIVKEDTFTMNHRHDDLSDIGCNFTRGGEGTHGRKWDKNESLRRSAACVKRWSEASERIKQSEKLKRACAVQEIKERRQLAQCKSWQSQERRHRAGDTMKAIWALRRFRRRSLIWFTKKPIDLTQCSIRSRIAYEVQNRPDVRVKNSIAQKAAWARRKAIKNVDTCDSQKIE